MLSVLLVLAAAPKLPSLEAPLGNYGAVVSPATSPSKDAERPVLFAPKGCEASSVSLMRDLSGTIRAVEQLQAWLGSTPGLDQRLFTGKGTLASMVVHLSASDVVEKKACAPVAVAKGQLLLSAAPKKFCPKAKPDSLTWFFNGDKPAAAIHLQPSENDACKVRLSTVLFDAKGLARLRVQADWAGVMSATLLGDKCQVIEFTFDSATQSFVPKVGACKR